MIILMMIKYGRQYDRVFSLWREINHPFTWIRFTWHTYIVGFIGYTFLACVAFGWLTKSGIRGLG